jgi:hypothetical protein
MAGVDGGQAEDGSQAGAAPPGADVLGGRPEVAADGGDQGRPGRERDRVDRERGPGRQREQEPADGRPGQLLGDDLGADQAAVGPLQPLGVAGDERGQDRVRPGVDQGLAGAEQEPDITRRRSQRSSSAPLSSPNSSQGSHSAKLTSDTSSGSRVKVAASSGSAVPYTPSPKFDTPAAPHNLANPVPPATLMGGG